MPAACNGLPQGLEAGIQSAVHYPLPIHLMPAYTDARYKAGDFPAAEACARTVLSLPVYEHLTRAQVEQVAQPVALLAGSRHPETVATQLK